MEEISIAILNSLWGKEMVEDLPNKQKVLGFILNSSQSKRKTKNFYPVSLPYFFKKKKKLVLCLLVSNYLYRMIIYKNKNIWRVWNIFGLVWFFKFRSGRVAHYWKTHTQSSLNLVSGISSHIIMHWCPGFISNGYDVHNNLRHLLSFPLIHHSVALNT